MPRGIYRRTEEHKRKISESGKGRHWKLSEETKKKMSEAKKNISENTRRKMRENHKGTLGKHFSEETKRKMSKAHSGINSCRWKGGIASGKNRKEYKRWKTAERKAEKIMADGSHTIGGWELLKRRYGYCCPACKKKEPEIKLTEDHIVPLSKGGSDYIENIQPLCKGCNSKKHTKIIIYQC